MAALALLSCLTGTFAAGADVHLYVSPSGNDNNNGLSSSHPLKTLTKAESRLYDADVRGNAVYIELMRGYHDVTSTITFTKEYGHPITFRSYNHEEAHVTGGKRLGASHFHPVTNPHVLQVIPAVAHHKVRQLRFSDVGISLSQLGQLDRFGFYAQRTAQLEVFYNSKPLQLARWPNDGSYVDVISTPDGEKGHRFTYSPSLDSRARKWKNENDLWVYGFWYWGWADDSVHVTSIDTNSRTMTLNGKISFGMRPGKIEPGASAGYNNQGGYFNVFNALSELDQEGEYYIDRKSGMLYLWPPEHSGTISNNDIIYASMISDIFHFSHVSSITIQDLVLEYCRHKAIEGDNLHSCNFERLEIRNTGSYGIGISYSTHITIRQCDVHDSDGGIIIDGGNRKTLSPSNILVENNHIHHFSRAGAVTQHGIWVGGVAAKVQFNEIHHGRYTGIWWWGNDNLIYRNHMHHLCIGSSDCGGIHSGRDWTFRGNFIKQNHIEHVLRFYPGADVRGIMLDDEYSSVTIEENVFHNNELHLNIGGGRDNVVRYNVFYNATKTGIGMDGRGLGHTGFASSLMDRLKEQPYKSTIWAKKYPKLAVIDSQQPYAPRGNQIYKNVFYAGSSKSKISYQDVHDIRKKEYYEIRDNLLYAQPGDFNNRAAGDYRLICEAKTWAQQQGVGQPPTLAEVGPHLPYGPTYKHVTIPRKTNSALRTDCHHSTRAPASHIPRGAFLNDGSRPNTVTDKVGCWFIITKCPNYPNMKGKHRDTYGEQHNGAQHSEKACLARAAEQWKACGSPKDQSVTAVYGPTG
ncbi:uncharacterized protein LOC135477063 [Liolophura sinensis]|uniref:uncharacterized protein LOC135477063 n=1 Tax=Liolophura sinensis TaxID=3198878 RepID=UPI0031585A27